MRNVIKSSTTQKSLLVSRLFTAADMQQIFFVYGISLRHLVCLISVRQTLFTCNTDLSSYLWNLTCLRATVAFSTAEYVPGSAHSCYNTRMIKTIYTAIIILIQHVRPLFLLHKCVVCKCEISKQNMLMSKSFILNFQFLSHRSSR